MFALPRVEALDLIQVRSETRPVPVVVRARSASWMMTSSPSRLRCTSSSISVAPISMARKGTQGIFRFVGGSPPVSNIMDHFHNREFSVSGSKWTFSGSNFRRT